MKKKAVFTFWILFIIFILLLIFILYFTIPLTSKINIELIKAGEQVLQQNQQAIQGIQNETIKQALLKSTNEALSSLSDQTVILNTFIKYGWIIIIIVALLAVFLLARQTVETQVLR